MTWKMIGQSVTGLSHLQEEKGCDDAVCYRTVAAPDGSEALVCFASDGAGSAQHAAKAAGVVTQMAVDAVAARIAAEGVMVINDFYGLAEQLLDELQRIATEDAAPLDEYLCTLLGAVVFPDRTFFLQVGDGAIVRNDGNNNYTYVWWPHTGEYQNTTSFLTDNADLRHLRIMELEEPVAELAVFTDGLQLLTLNNESTSVHQPFFRDMFRWLRMASEEAHIEILNRKLADYLGSELINSKTDDDKTLFLATRLTDDRHIQGNG